MNKPLKILSMPVDRAGCGHYRVRQPFQLIKDWTEHDCHIWERDEDDTVDITKAAAVADVAVVRQGGEQAISFFKTFPEFKNIKWVLDIDDNIEIISPYSQHYHEYGTQEIFDKNLGKWLWKDGESDFHLTRNRERVASLLQGMKDADMVTVTAPKLAAYAKHYNPNVRVLPNSIDLTHWWKPNTKPNEKLRVGWQGGGSHYEDWYTIRDPLNQLMRKYQFTLVMVGCDYMGVIDEDNKHLVEYWPWVSFEAHSYRMMCLSLDIAIIPLADLPFNAYKSAVKWYEMGAMGVPSVVSNITPYEEEITLETASPYKGAKGFYYALKDLLDYPAKRKEMGESAQRWVKEHADAKKNIHLWTDAYSSLLTSV